MIEKSEEEIRHAIRRFELVAEGCRISKLEAHARIADQSVDTLKWVLGEPSAFGDTLAEIDARVNGAKASSN